MTSNILTITVPANGKQVQNVPGRFFRCITGDTTVYVKADNDPERPISAGSGFGGPDKARFKKLVFRNATGSDIVIQFYAGDEDYTLPITTASGEPGARTNTPIIYNASNESKLISGAKWIKVYNNGTVDITVAGGTIAPGEYDEWPFTRVQDTYADMTIVCTGGGAAKITYMT